MMLTLLQNQPMRDITPWFMGGLSVLGLIIFLLLLFSFIFMLFALSGIKPRLNKIITEVNHLSGHLQRLEEQLKKSQTGEDSQGSGSSGA